MKILAAEFITSVVNGSEMPTKDLPVIALAGRSNVGKSSLINALVNRRIARAGAKPGTTRLLNVYRIRIPTTPRGSISFILVDLPGYGYARGGEQTKHEFDKLTRGFFQNAYAPTSSPTLKKSIHIAAVILVVDIRHPGLASDLSARAWVLDQHYPLVTVVTKSDRLKRTAKDKAWRNHAEVLGEASIVVSSQTGEGINKVWNELGQLLRMSGGDLL